VAQEHQKERQTEPSYGIDSYITISQELIANYTAHVEVVALLLTCGVLLVK